MKDTGYKSRKFVLTSALVALTTLLLVAGFVVEATWKEVILGVFFVFMTGHVGEKWVMKDANKNGIDDSLEAETSASNDAAGQKKKPVTAREKAPNEEDL